MVSNPAKRPNETRIALTDRVQHTVKAMRAERLESGPPEHPERRAAASASRLLHHAQRTL